MAEYGVSVVGLFRSIRTLNSVGDHINTSSESTYIIKAGGSSSEAPYAWFLEHGWSQAGNFYKYPFMRPARDEMVRARSSKVLEEFSRRTSYMENEQYGDDLLRFFASAIAKRAKFRVNRGIGKGGHPKTQTGDLVDSIRIEKKSDES